MKMIKCYLLAIALLSLGLSAHAQDARLILERMDSVLYAPKDMQGELKIILTDKNGKSKTRKANLVQKGIDRCLFRFTAPASQQGIATLSLPDDLMYLYLPAFGKVRRIASSVKSQKFAGTDFFYEDMEAKRYSDKYTPRLLKTDKQSYILELTPVSRRSPYAKLIIAVNRSAYYPTSIQYYNRANKLIKEATLQFEKIGKYWNNKEIVMVDVIKKHTTRMVKTGVKFDTGLSDDFFSVRNLKQQ